MLRFGHVQDWDEVHETLEEVFVKVANAALPLVGLEVDVCPFWSTEIGFIHFSRMVRSGTTSEVDSTGKRVSLRASRGGVCYGTYVDSGR